MNIDLKKKWVNALRSGKYKKGTGYLHKVDKSNHHKYCCLGVLCEVAGIPKGNKSQMSGSSVIGYKYTTDGRNLTEALCSKFDLLTSFVNALINLNDKRHKSFEYIAGYIEKEP